jgi:hypothetical protein
MPRSFFIACKEESSGYSQQLALNGKIYITLPRRLLFKFLFLYARAYMGGGVFTTLYAITLIDVLHI